MVFQLYHRRKPAPPDDLQLAQLLGMLSHALDLTSGQPAGHCVRSCWVGTRLGMMLGYSGQALDDLYYGLLLKDLGCSSNAAQVSAQYLADDIGFKQGLRLVDDAVGSGVQYVFAQTGLKASLAERIRALLALMHSGAQTMRTLVETRCQRGGEIAAQLRFSTPVQELIRCLDEHWDGRGQPQGLRGAAVPRAANIALLAQVVDVFHCAQGPAAALREVEARSGSWFDPDVVMVFRDLATDPSLWAGLTDPDIGARVFALPPGQRATPVDPVFLDDIAVAFAAIIDAKSPFTADHSARVTLYTDVIAEQMGLSAAHRRWLRRAALLHDLGKLGVSNQILDKPGPLDDVEWRSVRKHPLLSQKMLQEIPAFRDIAPIAGAHHERLDGAGYPLGLKGDEICLEARILTVADVFDALSADRPYRKALPVEDVFAMMEADVGTAFDGNCIAALRRGLKQLSAKAA